MVFHEEPKGEELEYDRALRPPTFAEFTGQLRVCENLKIAITAARARSEPLDHVLFAGPPGLGKTTLAHLIAQGMGVAITVTSGPALSGPKDLMGTLTRLERGEVLFVDEIHRMPRTVEEYLYTAMEDNAVDLPIDQGPAGRTVRVTLQPFTLVGATTREGLLSGPFRSRFGIVERLEIYPPPDLVKILERASGLLKFPLDADASALISERSRGVPRLALRLLRRVRDMAQVHGKKSMDLASARDGLTRLEIDTLGLEEIDRRILKALIDRKEPTGLKTLAAIVDEAEDTIEEVFEPHLLRLGLVVRTPKGRMASARAYTHLGLPPPKEKHSVPELPFPSP
jgi:Holliday junction DNA helicase RuvB